MGHSLVGSRWTRLAMVAAWVGAGWAAARAQAPETAAPLTELTLEAVRTCALLDTGKPLEWGSVATVSKTVKARVGFRAVFRVEEVDRFASLTVERDPGLTEVTLNGLEVLPPVQGMLYRSVPGVLTPLLKKGENVLSATWTTAPQTLKAGAEPTVVMKGTDLPLRLFGLTPQALAFQTGPVLGHAGPDFFTVACRTNMPAEVTLEVDGRTYRSRADLMHALKAEGLRADTEYAYTLTARPADGREPAVAAGPYTVRTLPAGGRLVFAALGDSRTFAQNWAMVAAATLKARPAFALFMGDMVTAGRNDWEWDEQFFGVARPFFAAVPFYPVIGNHEQNAPVIPKLFPLPAERCWTQEVGPALLIGIDGAMNWSADGPQAKWLEGVLAQTQAKFIFLASHYPAWSSGAHGRLNADGTPRETTMVQARDVILPLLKKYRATAMFVGHDHNYERSEPENGITQITTGGAGAPLGPKLPGAEKQNPGSQLFEAKLHYCLITVDGDTCTMQAITPDEKIIDTRQWKAR